MAGTSSRKLPMRFIFITLAFSVTATVPALSDAVSGCMRFDNQKQVTILELPSEVKDAAKMIFSQTMAAAEKLGVGGVPVLISLPHIDPGSSFLGAYVAKPNGDIVVLSLHSTKLGQTHSLVDLPPIFMFYGHEPEERERTGTGGVTYKFFDSGYYSIRVDQKYSVQVDSEYNPIGKPRFKDTINTGYTSGGLSRRCRQVLDKAR